MIVPYVFQSFKTEEDLLQAAQSDVAQLCAENVILWMQYLELVSLNEKITHQLAKDHHNQRVCRPSSFDATTVLQFTFAVKKPLVSYISHPHNWKPYSASFIDFSILCHLQIKRFAECFFTYEYQKNVMLECYEPRSAFLCICQSQSMQTSSRIVFLCWRTQVNAWGLLCTACMDTVIWPQLYEHLSISTLSHCWRYTVRRWMVTRHLCPSFLRISTVICNLPKNVGRVSKVTNSAVYSVYPGLIVISLSDIHWCHIYCSVLCLQASFSYRNCVYNITIVHLVWGRDSWMG